MSNRVLSLALLPALALTLAFGVSSVAKADPGDTEVIAEDDQHKVTRTEVGGGGSIEVAESKMTGYWVSSYVDENGKKTQIASGKGDGSVRKSGSRPTPVPMDPNGSNEDHITVVQGDGWTQTTINNQDGTAIIVTTNDDGSWTTRAEDADGNDRLVAAGDGKGNVVTPNK